MFLICQILFTVYDINPQGVQDLIQSGLGYAYVENFDSAVVYFDSVIQEFPKNPAGYFFKAALLQVRMLDECQYSFEAEYLKLVKKTIDCAKEILDEEENLWAQFYLASGYAYLAVYEGMKKNYLETFKYGVRGGRMLEDLIKRDSTFYDAYLGAGSFEYFWARAARYLPVLKLVGGDAKEAIRKIQVAARKSLYSGPTAENALVFIYTEEGEFEDAVSVADRLLIHYPASRTFLWSKASTEYKRGNYIIAVSQYEKLFSIYNSHSEPNYANLAQCKLFIGRCFYKLKNKSSAKEALRDVIGYKEYSEKYPQIREYCQKAYSLLSLIL